MRLDAIERRINKLEKHSPNKKRVVVIEQGDKESAEQAERRHYAEHPEDKNAELSVLIRNFCYEAQHEGTIDARTDF